MLGRINHCDAYVVRNFHVHGASAFGNNLWLESMAVPRGDLRAGWRLMWAWGGSVAGREATWQLTATTRREKWSRTGTRQTLRTVSF